MQPLLVCLQDNDSLAATLETAVGASRATLERRQFPDGETYLRFDTDLQDRHVIVYSTLDRPDRKILPLLFTAMAARDLGAASIGLVSPYLAYMRQDERFRSGEAVTSVHFAKLLSDHIDWLVTVDPHLHRHKSLSEIFDVPAIAVHAAPLIADWIQQSVESPLLIGPDEESKQWVAAVAKEAHAPFAVLNKTRHGDRKVEVSVPDIGQWQGCTPILVDDIISTGQTMIKTIAHLAGAGMQPPLCVGVHGVFAGDAFHDLMKAGAGSIVTTNTIAHQSNAIDVSELLANAIRELLVNS
ncbi:MAG: ribose-phosphate pyrophosphokinase [Roseibium sp.]|uniref:ribose-phosphate pyrophosphokinase n=1 Tax=Roseibium sp. TaxID=1936156 RepID=UPI002606EB87|nr:ribose-phosphate pyrophosphokinase [Roseibium sp.]MCV0426476.1 ribose-phosphate pyrophosphokinase [Roseibium sp.]